MTGHGTTETGANVLMLGITRDTINALLAGRPVVFTQDTHPDLPDNWEVSLVFGETEKHLLGMYEQRRSERPGREFPPVDKG